MSIIERPVTTEVDPLEQIPVLPEEPTVNPKRGVFLRAIEIIEERGWEQGGGNPTKGPLCLMEAVALARREEEPGIDVADFVYLNEVGDRYMGNDGQTSYNPHVSVEKDAAVGSCWAWNDIVCNGGDQAIGVLQALADGKTWAEATA